VFYVGIQQIDWENTWEMYKPIFDALKENLGINVFVIFRRQQPRTVYPLSGNGQAIVYTGDINIGFEVTWGNAHFSLTVDECTQLLTEFEHRQNVPLGALHNGGGRPDSLGVWIHNHLVGRTAQHASAIAPILIDVGIIANFYRNHGFYLNFS
jgi:hypothetical protein